MDIYYTQKFLRDYKKIDRLIKIQAEKKQELFKLNPHSAQLKTHKLQGPLADFWSFSINQTYRIIFEFDTDGDAIFHAIGDYSIYN